MNWEIAAALVSAILASGLIQFLISRADGKKEGIKRIEDKLDAHIVKDDRRDAVQCRVRILRFADDLRIGLERSKSSYEQVLADLDSYNSYCLANPSFRNHMTTAAEQFIIDAYNEHLRKNDFIA